MTFNPSQMKTSTKALLLAVFGMMAAMQVDTVKDHIMPLVANHPHLSSLATGFFFLATLLHNPMVQEMLGIKTTRETKETADGPELLKTTQEVVPLAPGTQGSGAISIDRSKVPVIALLFLLPLMGLMGCDDFERQTFKTLSASKAVIDQAQVDYEAGKLPRTQTVYAAVNKAKDVQAAGVKALQAYHASASIENRDKVRAITTQLGPLVDAVRALYVQPKASVDLRTSPSRGMLNCAARAASSCVALPIYTTTAEPTLEAAHVR